MTDKKKSCRLSRGPGHPSSPVGKTPREPAVTTVLKGFTMPGIVAGMNRLPEIRGARVLEIRQRIESGSYTVDSRKIAEKMLRKS